MPVYTRKKIVGTGDKRYWVGFVIFTLLFGNVLAIVIVFLKDTSRYEQEFIYAILLLLLFITGLLFFSIYKIKKPNEMYVILTENAVVYYDGKIKKKIYFKNNLLLKSEHIFDLSGGFFTLLILRRYKIYLHDGETEIVIKEYDFPSYDMGYIFAWIAEHSLECDFGVQDKAGYLQKVRKSDLQFFKSIRTHEEDRTKKRSRDSAVISIVIAIVVISVEMTLHVCLVNKPIPKSK